MFRPLVVTLAALAATTLTAIPAVAAPTAVPAAAVQQLVPAQTGGSTPSAGNTCANPVLAQNATGWTASGGSRQPVTGHVAAQYGFRVTTSFFGRTITVTLPNQTTTAGQQRTFAFDVQLAGSVRPSVEWFNAAGRRLSRVDGTAVTGTATGWTRVAISATAPAGATRASVLATGTLGANSQWKSTACDYSVAAGTTTTTTPPPTTTTVPPTTTTVPPTTTTVPPTTTTVPPTTVPPTTTTPAPPNPGEGTQAATKYGWGNPVIRDEFDGTAVDPAKWALYDSPGHAGNGLRKPSQIGVANGVLTLTGNSVGTTGGMSMHYGRKYGRWEARMQVPAGDYRYHPVLLLWPDAENWPVGGEVDYAETTAAANDVDFFLHYSSENRTTHANTAVNLTGWHNYAVEWTSTGIRGYVDGVQFFSDTTRSHLPPGAMHQTIQLDWFPNGSSPTTQSKMNVAWVRVYA